MQMQTQIQKFAFAFQKVQMEMQIVAFAFALFEVQIQKQMQIYFKIGVNLYLLLHLHFKKCKSNTKRTICVCICTFLIQNLQHIRLLLRSTFLTAIRRTEKVVFSLGPLREYSNWSPLCLKRHLTLIYNEREISELINFKYFRNF